MIDKRLLKKYTLEDCTQIRRELGVSLRLTKERLKRLKKKQAENPAWAAYDKYADAFVGIDIRIEEQEAVLEELKRDIELVNARAQEIVEEAKRVVEKERRDKEVQLELRI
jgi:hypothetical protein